MDEIKKTDRTNKFDSRRAATRLANLGYRIYGWDVEWRMRSGEAIEPPETVVLKLEEILAKKRTTKKGKVVLLAHDVMFRESVGGKTLLEQLIAILTKKGHGMSFISEY